MPDLRQSCRDVLGMRGGVLDFPQPRVAVRRIVNDEVFSGIYYVTGQAGRQGEIIFGNAVE